MSALIIIPARMGSTRLPGKPLADIQGLPMIAHVLKRAQKAALGPVWVACGEREIKMAVESVGGDAVLTDPDLPSGTDRVRAAANAIDPRGSHDIIINVQGDMPTLDPALLQVLVKTLENGNADIATAAVETQDIRELSDPNVVKAVLAKSQDLNGVTASRALYFSRAALPYGSDRAFHHLGVYAYRRDALERFCSLDTSPLEITERLEQLRALEADMRIDVAIVSTAPQGVDTQEDLERARDMLSPEKNNTESLS